MVETQKTRKNFGHLEVPKGINVEVPRGTVTCSIGSSGSGEPALLRYVNHLEKVDASRSYVDDSLIGRRGKDGSLYEIFTTEATRQRRDIGIMFQNFSLFPHRTVLGNIIEAPVLVKDVSQERVEKHIMELLKAVGLVHKADVYSVQLSGGQQQRVAIMRTLAMEPKLMLFDKPISALGPELVGEVLNVIRGLTDKGTTMIVVMYEMDFAREVTDQVVFMTGGVVVEESTPDEILGSPKHERTRGFLSLLLR